MKAVRAQELLVTVENRVGALAEVANLISSAGINIRTISAWAVGNSASFRLITSDNIKTKEILANHNYTIEEKDIIVVELPDRVGELNNLTTRLKAAGVDLIYLYGTSSKPGTEALIVLSSNNNEKALEVLTSKSGVTS